jgi:hypothetical protein
LIGLLSANSPRSCWIHGLFKLSGLRRRQDSITRRQGCDISGLHPDFSRDFKTPMNFLAPSEICRRRGAHRHRTGFVGNRGIARISLGEHIITESLTDLR